jgi:hypothetical protein
MKDTLDKLNMKFIEPCRIVIIEDKDYELHLARTWDGTVYEILGLYRVTTRDGIDHYVIAEDKDGAISQSNCGIDQKDDRTAVAIPLIIRGWGNRKFKGIELQTKE